MYHLFVLIYLILFWIIFISFQQGNFDLSCLLNKMANDQGVVINFSFKINKGTLNQQTY